MMNGKKRIWIYTWTAMFFFAVSFLNIPHSFAAEGSFDLSALDFSAKRLILQTAQPVTDDSAIQIEGGYGGFYVLEYETEEDAKKAYEIFCKMDGTKAVQPDAKVRLAEAENAAGSEKFLADFSNSALYSWCSVTRKEHTFLSWGAQDTGIDELYHYLQDSFTELPQVEVAVLDTGIDSDLAIFEGRILPGGKNFCFRKRTPEDDNGHGTSVSGIIADQTLSNVKILPLKVMDKKGEGYDSNIVMAMLYALECDVDIINMSIGGDGEKEIYANVLEMARQQGVAVIAAAGNESGDVEACTPANMESTIAVSSINKSGRFSGFSNYGSTIDFTAPGEAVHVITMGGGSKYINGTSFAAPHVTAAFALMKSLNGSWDGEDIYQILKENAADLGASGWDKQFGYGKINLKGLQRLFENMATIGYNAEPGTYGNEVSLAFETNKKDMDIYYTTNSSQPSLENGILYTEPVRIDEPMIVHAAGYVNGVCVTQVFEGYYDITSDAYKPGDVDKDGAATSVDAYYILQMLVGRMQFTEFQMQLADANKDGEVNSIDALWILQKEIGR